MVLVLLGLGLLVWGFAPEKPIDPWGLFNLKKLGTIFWALSVLQVAGAWLVRWLGGTWSTVLSGFLGGFVSSTAVTLTSAQRTRDKKEGHRRAAAEVTAACLGMQVEAFVLLLLSSASLAWTCLPILLGMLIPGGAALLGWARRQTPRPEPHPKEPVLDLGHSLQLTLVIAGFLLLVGLGKHQLGTSGVWVLSFVASLFEMHGVIVANSQLYATGHLSLEQTHALVFVGLLAAHLSKVVIAFFFGSRPFALAVGAAMGLMLLGGGLVTLLT